MVGLEALEWGLGNKYPGELDRTMVLVRHLECETDANGTEKCTDWNAVTCYDFLPEEPASPATAATLLSGGSVKGKLRTRTLRGIPKRKCEFVGQAEEAGADHVGGADLITKIEGGWLDFDLVSLEVARGPAGKVCRTVVREHLEVRARVICRGRRVWGGARKRPKCKSQRRA